MLKYRVLPSLVLLALIGSIFSSPGITNAQSTYNNPCTIDVSVNGTDATFNWDASQLHSAYLPAVVIRVETGKGTVYSNAGPNQSSGNFTLSNFQEGYWQAIISLDSQYPIVEGTSPYGGDNSGSCYAEDNFFVGAGSPPPPVPGCVINSFAPDNIMPPINSDTNLRFTFSGIYPWSIFLFPGYGTTLPVPSSGNWSSGVLNTGNISAMHFYFLYCLDGSSSPPMASTLVWPQSGSGFDDAQFVSQNIPSLTMTTGSTQTVSVTMKNIGDTVWNQVDGYKLGSDSTVWLNGDTRIILNANDSIVQNESKQFTFVITAPATPGVYPFQWGMVKEYVHWFGVISDPINITVISAGPTGSISASSCTVPNNAATCNIALNWTTSNLTANPTEVTRDNPASTHISSATSGTNVSDPVPPTTNGVYPGNYTYYLYHNSVLLGQSSQVSATCTAGSIWNGSICEPTPTNGVCSPSHYLCAVGNSTNNVAGPLQWTWDCTGLNGGATVSCGESSAAGPGPGAVNGICSQAHYECLIGSPSNQVDGASAWTWVCSGATGGNSESCLEDKPGAPLNASCGLGHYACYSGTSISNIDHGSSWSWDCQGSGVDYLNDSCWEFRTGKEPGFTEE